MIVRTRDGRHRRCRIDAGALQAASDWIGTYRQFWTTSFDRLDAHLKARQSAEEDPWQAPPKPPPLVHRASSC